MNSKLIFCLLVLFASQDSSAGLPLKIGELPSALIEAILDGDKDSLQQASGLETSINQLYLLKSDDPRTTNTLTMLGFASYLGASNAVGSLLQLGADPFQPIQSSEGLYALPIDICYDFKADAQSFACVSLLATAMKTAHPEQVTNLWDSIVIRLPNKEQFFFIGFETIAENSNDAIKSPNAKTRVVACMDNSLLRHLPQEMTQLFYQSDVRAAILTSLRDYSNIMPFDPHTIELSISREDFFFEKTQRIVFADVISTNDEHSFKPFTSILVAVGWLLEGSKIQIESLHQQFYVFHDGVYISTRHPIEIKETVNK